MLTFKELSDKFLVWSKVHRPGRTAEWYENYLKMFVAWPGIAETPAADLKVHQVQEWIDSHGDNWGDNYRGGAVVAIKRVYAWADEQGHMETNPIKKMKKPPSKRRKSYMKPEDYETYLKCMTENDPFRALLMFVWTTGCRPQEVRHIEPRHVNLEKGYILFPKEESKGKRVPRMIILNTVAKEIIVRCMGERTEDKVFLNTDHAPWTKYSICNRMHRLSEETGIKLCLYDARHGYATRKLKAKHGHLEIAATMGHTDGSMIAKVYSHIDEDLDHLRTVMED